MENGTIEKQDAPQPETEGKPSEPQKMEGEPKYIFRDTRNGDALCFDQTSHTVWIGFKIFPATKPWDVIRDGVLGTFSRAFFIWLEYMRSIEENQRIQAKLQAGQRLSDEERAKATNKGWLTRLMKH